MTGLIQSFENASLNEKRERDLRKAEFYAQRLEALAPMFNMPAQILDRKITQYCIMDDIHIKAAALVRLGGIQRGLNRLSEVINSPLVHEAHPTVQ